MTDRQYVCIDLKSFYASVECIERNLDPMTTNLVVADPTRTEKTICLAVTPAMKALGVPGRCRVFEIPKNIEYIMAPPRMQLYIDYSSKIYEIYLKYISKDDIHVYSIDEVFIDVTDYLKMYNMTAKELGITIINDITNTTGITATCGIGTNLYLAKIALDITAKHVDDHIGILTEDSYKELLWDHKPITDFWRIGKGIAKQLENLGIYTMRDIANADENMLYRHFGIDAELMIDHAFGRETTLMSDIKAYKPSTNSITSGQVLGTDTNFSDGLLLVKEMIDLMCLDLVDKNMITDSVTLHISYSGRFNEKPAHGTTTLPITTSSAKQITKYVSQLYQRIVSPYMPIRRIGISFNNIIDEMYQQYDLFIDPADLEKEKKLQQAMLDIKHKFGKNAILKGMNLLEGAKTIERNSQIGGHKSGN
ncbi:MAG: DNA repair protein [Lachnospiraceae bacterium]|nr:DNA repair protein [Lachnospiraceae bacterium]